MKSDEKLIIILGKTDDFSVGEIFGEIFQAPFKDCDFGYFFGYFWEKIGEILSKSSSHTVSETPHLPRWARLEWTFAGPKFLARSN